MNQNRLNCQKDNSREIYDSWTRNINNDSNNNNNNNKV